MRRPTFFALSLLLLFPPAVLAQTPSTDSQTLQALLAEVRQLRQDLRTSALAAQRAQILIYRVQAQETIVRRAQERVDDNRLKLAQTHFDQKRLGEQIKESEDQLGRSETSPVQHKELEDVLAQLRARLEQQTNVEQETQPKLIEAEELFRIEQAKLGKMQDELDRLDKALENASQSSGSKPQ